MDLEERDCCESERDDVGRLDSLEESLGVDVVVLRFATDLRVRKALKRPFCAGGAISAIPCVLPPFPAAPVGEAVQISSSSGAPLIALVSRPKPRLRDFCILFSFSCFCLSLSLLSAIRSLKLFGCGAVELFSEAKLVPRDMLGRFSSDPN